MQHKQLPNRITCATCGGYWEHKGGDNIYVSAFHDGGWHISADGWHCDQCGKHLL